MAAPATLRRLRTVARLLLTLLLAAPALARPRIVEVVLTTEGFAKFFGSVDDDGRLRFEGRIPKLFVYLKDGSRTAIIHGYSPELTGRVSKALFAAAAQPRSDLAGLMAVVRTAAGEELSVNSVLTSGGVVAEFQAPWCLPCRAVRRDLESLDESVTVLSIDADTRRVDLKKVYKFLIPREN